MLLFVISSQGCFQHYFQTNLSQTLLPKEKQHFVIPHFVSITTTVRSWSKLSEYLNKALSKHFCTAYSQLSGAVKRSLNLHQVS